MTQYDFEAMNHQGVFRVTAKNLTRATSAALVHFGLGASDRARIWFRGSRSMGRSLERIWAAREQEVRGRRGDRQHQRAIDPFDREILGL